MRVIDADALLESMRPKGLEDEAWTECTTYKMIQAAPTIESPKEIWRWLSVPLSGGQSQLICQRCYYETKHYANMRYNYCPNCGVKLINGKDV